MEVEENVIDMFVFLLHQFGGYTVDTIMLEPISNLVYLASRAAAQYNPLG